MTVAANHRSFMGAINGWVFLLGWWASDSWMRSELCFVYVHNTLFYEWENSFRNSSVLSSSFGCSRCLLLLCCISFISCFDQCLQFFLPSEQSGQFKDAGIAFALPKNISTKLELVFLTNGGSKVGKSIESCRNQKQIPDIVRIAVTKWMLANWSQVN